MPQDERQPTADALTGVEAIEVLTHGTIEVQGRMPWSSNATLLATVSTDAACIQAIYKPGRGERPLWDFPDGLFRREVAAYALSEALHWAVVPETVLRADGPFGTGSLQRFVDADFAEQYFTLLDDEDHHADLRAMAAFDLLANNADRKAGHCLLDGDGHIWGIDNGLCFHVEPKLRTVIWDFAGEAIPEHLVADVARLAVDLPTSLSPLLHPVELAALARRLAAVARRPVFPEPTGHHHDYPWPMV